ncbi:sugar ABC transporter ATP-binding protein [Bacillus sp. FJAT-50079]|uniref:sugar ABC transporter ATP-binding protein n=1 Tax=Bacillus sp. FJAT-50079 TaxID=2833577 RepID=UPI0032D57B22
MVLEMDSISIRFPGVLAVDNANLSVKAGEVRSLVGENGAGKSTLMKALSGVHPSGNYDGEIRLEGKTMGFQGVADAEKNGIIMVPQELNLVDDLSIAENLFMNQLPENKGFIDYFNLYSEAERIMKEVGLHVSPITKVKELGVAQKQMVVIGRALWNKVKVLILDEPTSTLSNLESEILFAKIKEFQQRGIAVIYISHRLEEVLAISDSITVMRDGRIIDTKDVEEMNEQKIVSLMIGRDLDQFFPPIVRKSGKEILNVQNFTVYDPKLPGRKLVDDVSFALKEGEILGLFGLVGAGRTELAMGLIGAWDAAAEGKVFMEENLVKIESPWDAIQSGIGYLPEDRKSLAIIPELSVSKNISVSTLEKLGNYGMIDSKIELIKNHKFVEDLNIKTASLDTTIKSLSGGNQQKCILARLIAVNSKVMILDEPTQGVDVGAKSEIYNILDQLAKEGKAILMISSDLPEVLGVSDRVMIMRQGKLVSTLIPEETDRQVALEYATLGKIS